MTVTPDLDTPDGWVPTKLRHLLKLNPPVPTALRSSRDEVSFLPMELIGEDGSLDLSRTRPVQDVLTGYSYYANGDVLMAKVTPCFENGKAALVRNLPTEHGFGTTEITVIGNIVPVIRIVKISIEIGTCCCSFTGLITVPVIILSTFTFLGPFMIIHNYGCGRGDTPHHRTVTITSLLDEVGATGPRRALRGSA